MCDLDGMSLNPHYTLTWCTVIVPLLHTKDVRRKRTPNARTDTKHPLWRRYQVLLKGCGDLRSGQIHNFFLNM